MILLYLYFLFTLQLSPSDSINCFERDSMIAYEYRIKQYKKEMQKKDVERKKNTYNKSEEALRKLDIILKELQKRK